jgi:hypothetical protein
MQHRVIRSSLLAVATLGATLLAAPAFSQDDYYAGKTIEVVVPFSQGGATYVSAKFLEPFFEKHIPGNPDMNVVDRPGGGSILGANWFAANAEPDGMTLLFTTSSTANPYVLGKSEVEYDLAAMRIAYSHPFGAVAYTSPATGVKTAADILKPEQPLIYGGIAAAASDLPGLLSFEVLKLDVKAVLGFPGRGPIRLAFERGETNLDYQFTPVYLTQVRQLIDAGKAIPLWSGGAVGADGGVTERDPIAPDIPSVYEVYQTLYGEEPGGLAWDAFQAIAAVTYAFGLTAYMPPDTPQEVIDIFNQAVADINADPEFQQASLDVTGGAKLVPGSVAEPLIKKSLQPSDELRGYLRDLLSEKYGVQF